MSWLKRSFIRGLFVDRILTSECQILIDCSHCFVSQSRQSIFVPIFNQANKRSRNSSIISWQLFHN